MPQRFKDRPAHAHNRLLTSVVLTADERRDVARALCAKLSGAKGPVVVYLPEQGGNDWDRPCGPLADPAALAAFCDQMRQSCPPNVRLIPLSAHINAPAFHDAELSVSTLG